MYNEGLLVGLLPSLVSSVGAKQLSGGSALSISRRNCPRYGGDVQVEWVGREHIAV